MIFSLDFRLAPWYSVRMDDTPGSTTCNFNKVQNLSTDRLQRRLNWLNSPVEQSPDRREPTTNLGIKGRQMEGHSGSGRGPMADAAKEVLLIAYELERRESTRDEDIRDWTVDLLSLLPQMDVPESRLGMRPEDIRWLHRNLHVRNRGHEDFKRASRLVRKLLDAQSNAN